MRAEFTAKFSKVDASLKVTKQDAKNLYKRQSVQQENELSYLRSSLPTDNGMHARIQKFMTAKENQSSGHLPDLYALDKEFSILRAEILQLLSALKL